MSKTIKNISIFIASAIVLVAIYMIFFNKPKEELISSDKVSVEVGMSNNSLISLLLELRSIKLEDRIFNLEVFRNLLDFGIEIDPQPIGRNNPFSLIGSPEDE